MDMLLDIGNHRIKWARSDDVQKWLAGDGSTSPQDDGCNVIHFPRGNLLSEFSRQFRDVPRPESVWVSSVGGPDAVSEIQAASRRLWGIEPNFASSSRHHGGIVNGYDQPQQLGVDRWLAMIGARRYAPDRAVLVIDAGTAITIDHVDSGGFFAGGVIVPGLVTMMDSLHQAAGLVNVGPNLKDNHRLVLQNPDTETAILNGALHAMAASVAGAVAHYRELSDEDPVVVGTGGDASLLKRFSGIRMREIPGLVLFGLYIVSRESAC